MESPTEDKVIDPESIEWIEHGKGPQDDEEYFASAWRRALSEAQGNASPVRQDSGLAPSRQR